MIHLFVCSCEINYIQSQKYTDKVILLRENYPTLKRGLNSLPYPCTPTTPLHIQYTPHTSQSSRNVFHIQQIYHNTTITSITTQYRYIIHYHPLTTTFTTPTLLQFHISQTINITNTSKGRGQVGQCILCIYKINTHTHTTNTITILLHTWGCVFVLITHFCLKFEVSVLFLFLA